MDAILAETSLTYGGPPPLLVAASSDAALRRATATADAMGQRVGAQLRIEEALQRLKQQAAASAIWIEADRDCGDSLEALLDEVDERVSTTTCDPPSNSRAPKQSMVSEVIERTAPKRRLARKTCPI